MQYLPRQKQHLCWFPVLELRNLFADCSIRRDLTAETVFSASKTEVQAYKKAGCSELLFHAKYITVESCSLTSLT